MAGVELATAYVSLVVSGSKVAPGVRKALGGAEGEARRSGSRAGKLFGQSMTASSRGPLKLLSGQMVRTFGAAAVVGGLAKTINLAKNFDLTIRQIGVQTGQTGTKLDGLRKLALKMGADTAFSAKDASDAMLELAKGGLTAAQIKAGALKTTMTLAAAGGLDLGNAASFVTQGMTTFGLSAASANRVAIALAGGANASTASVESLGQALSQVGPGARNAGVNLGDTVAVLSAFDNAGIKGSDAGTSFKTMLSRLTPQTLGAQEAMHRLNLDFVNADGSFVSISNVAQQLKKNLGGLGQSQRQQALTTIFGSDATRAATVLMNNGAKGLDKYRKATRDGTTVQKMANTAMGGASGAWNQFTGSVETAAIQLGTKMLPAFTKAAKKGADFVNEAMTWGPGIKRTFGPTVEVVGSVVKAMKPLADIAVDVGKGVAALPGPVKSLAIQAAIAAVVFPRLAAGLQSAGASFLMAGARARQFGAEMTYAETRAAHVNNIVGKLKGGAGVVGLLALGQAAHESNGSLKTLETVGGAALMGFAIGGPIGGAVAGGAAVLWRLATAGGGAGKAIKAAVPDIGSIIGTLNRVTGAATRTTTALTINTITKQGGFKALNEAKAAYGGLAISEDDLVKASMGNVAAQKRVASALGEANSALKKSSAGDSSKYATVQKLAKATDSVNKIIGSNAKQNAKAATETRRNYRITATQKDLLKHDLPAAAKQSSKTLRDLSAASQRSAKGMDRLGGSVKKVPKAHKTVITTPGAPQAHGLLSAIANDVRNIPGFKRIDLAVHAAISAAVQGGGPKPRRAGGGPVRENRPYTVGEFRPELFIPNTSGRIVPSVPTGVAADGQRLVLVLDDGTQLGAYVKRQASTVVNGRARLNRETMRASR